jgi:hypothetical protein
VSADSILEAVHRTFDSLLKQTEARVLIDELTRLLTGMRGKLAGDQEWQEQTYSSFPDVRWMSSVLAQ